MSNIRNRKTGKLMTDDEFRASIPTRVLPAILSKVILNAEGCDPVYNTAPPPLSFVERAVLNGATLEIGSDNQPTGNWIQNWVKVPLTAQEIAVKTQQYINEFEIMVSDLVQKRLDTFAHTRNYGDRYGVNAGISCASYSGSTNTKYRNEANYFIAKREETWNKVYEIKAKVLAEEMMMPSSYAEIEALLPDLLWPD